MDQKKEDWLPVTPQDWQVKEVPGDPGASAIQLFYADYIDDNAQTEFIYHRRKILTDKGMKYGDVEIPLLRNSLEIKDLKARTIHPDGSIVEFTGKPFEKTIIKGRGIKYTAKTFTFPDVSVGSIVEYKYKLRFENTSGFSSDNWILQHELFTVQEHVSFKPFEGGVANEYYWPGAEIAWVATNLKEQPKKIGSNGGAELEMRNVPAFQSEGFMPPEDNYKPTVHFFYLRPDIRSPEKYWEIIGKALAEYMDRFIGNHKEAREAAAAAIGNETDPEKKLRKLYARAQEIRNISYERERTEEERKKEKIKDNEGVAEVFKRGYGDGPDITRAFVAMARAAGFDASIVLASNRRERFFEPKVLSARQLDTELAVVKLNGQDVYLDPGTKYCPYGLLRWMQTSTQGLKLNKKDAVFITVPAVQQDKAVTRRTVQASIEEDGTLKGQMVVQFTGLEALERRLDAIDADEAGRKKQFEDDIKEWLPNSAVVKFKDIKGLQETDSALEVSFSLEIPAYASSTGKRLLVPPYLFQVKNKDVFSHAERKYPVYFPYAFAEFDVVNLKVPQGVSVESVPAAAEASLPYARYRNVSQLSNGQLNTQRVLIFNVIWVSLKDFPDIKDFFNKVTAGDEQQAVLKTGGSTNAEKGN